MDPLNETEKKVGNIIKEPQQERQNSLVDLAARTQQANSLQDIANTGGSIPTLDYGTLNQVNQIEESAYEEKKRKLFGGYTPEEKARLAEKVNNLTGYEGITEPLKAIGGSVKDAASIAANIASLVPEGIVEGGVKAISDARNLADATSHNLFGTDLNWNNKFAQLEELRNQGVISPEQYLVEKQNLENQYNDFAKGRDAYIKNHDDLKSYASIAQKYLDDPSRISKDIGYDKAVKSSFNTLGLNVDMSPELTRAFNETGKGLHNLASIVTGAKKENFDPSAYSKLGGSDLLKMGAITAGSLLATRGLGLGALAASESKDAEHNAEQAAKDNNIKQNIYQKQKNATTSYATGIVDAAIDKATLGGKNVLKGSAVARSLSKLKKEPKAFAKIKSSKLHKKASKAFEAKSKTAKESLMNKSLGSLYKAGAVGSDASRWAIKNGFRATGKGLTKGSKIASGAAFEGATEVVQEGTGTYLAMKDRYENKTGKSGSYKDILDSASNKEKENFYSSIGAGFVMGAGAKAINPIVELAIPDKATAKEKMEARDEILNNTIKLHEEKNQELEKQLTQLKPDSFKYKRTQKEIDKNNKIIDSIKENKQQNIDDINTKIEEEKDNIGNMYKNLSEDEMNNILRTELENKYKTEDNKKAKNIKIDNMIQKHKNIIEKQKRFIDEAKMYFNEKEISKKEYNDKIEAAINNISASEKEITKLKASKEKIDENFYKDPINDKNFEKKLKARLASEDKKSWNNKPLKTRTKEKIKVTFGKLKRKPVLQRQKAFADEVTKLEEKRSLALNAINGGSLMDKIKIGSDLLLSPEAINEKYDNKIKDASRKHKITHYSIDNLLSKQTYSKEDKSQKQANTSQIQTEPPSIDEKQIKENKGTEYLYEKLNKDPEEFNRNIKMYMEEANKIGEWSKLSQESQREIVKRIESIMKYANTRYEIVEDNKKAENIDDYNHEVDTEPKKGSDKRVSSNEDFGGIKDKGESVISNSKKATIDVNDKISEATLFVNNLIDKISSSNNIASVLKETDENSVTLEKNIEKNLSILNQLIQTRERQLVFFEDNRPKSGEKLYFNNYNTLKKWNNPKVYSKDLEERLRVEKDRLKKVFDDLNSIRGEIASNTETSLRKFKPKESNSKIIKLSEDEYNDLRKEKNKRVKEIKQENKEEPGYMVKNKELNPQNFLTIFDKLFPKSSSLRKQILKKNFKENLIKLYQKKKYKNSISLVLQNFPKNIRNEFYSKVAIDKIVSDKYYNTENEIGLNYGEINKLVKENKDEEFVLSKKEAKKLYDQYDNNEISIKDIKENIENSDGIEKLKWIQKHYKLTKRINKDKLKNRNNDLIDETEDILFQYDNFDLPSFMENVNINTILASRTAKEIHNELTKQKRDSKDENFFANKLDEVVGQINRKNSENNFKNIAEAVVLANMIALENEDIKIKYKKKDYIINSLVNNISDFLIEPLDEEATKKEKKKRFEKLDNIKSKYSYLSRKETQKEYTNDDIVLAEKRLFSILNDIKEFENSDSNDLIQKNNLINSLEDAITELNTVSKYQTKKDTNYIKLDDSLYDNEIRNELRKTIKVTSDEVNNLSFNEIDNTINRTTRALEDLRNKYGKVSTKKSFKNFRTKDQKKLYRKYIEDDQGIASLIHSGGSEDVMNKAIGYAKEIARMKTIRNIKYEQERLDRKNQAEAEVGENEIQKIANQLEKDKKMSKIEIKSNNIQNKFQNFIDEDC